MNLRIKILKLTLLLVVLFPAPLSSSDPGSLPDTSIMAFGTENSIRIPPLSNEKQEQVNQQTATITFPRPGNAQSYTGCVRFGR